MLAKLPELNDGLIDISFNRRWLETTFNIIRFSQCMTQGLWHTDHFLCQLPHFQDEEVKKLMKGLTNAPKTMTEYLRTPILRSPDSQSSLTSKERMC
jgi:preprotein translocase subunit Sec63